MRISVVFALFLLLTLASSLRAQTLTGIGTRAEGMGGAFVAVADDATAIYWNPAGIATGATFDFQVSGGSDSALFVGASLPVLGASFYRTRQLAGLTTVQDPASRENEGSGEVPTRTITTANIGVTVVQTVARGLVIGTTLRSVSADVDSVDSGSSFDFDVGGMVSAGSLRVGLVARNVREAEFEIDAGVIRMPRQFRLGAALAPRSLPTGVHGPYSLAVDVDLTTTQGLTGERRGAAVGGEYWLARGFVGLRGGVRWSTLGDSNRAFSGGFTVRLPKSFHVEGQVTEGTESEEAHWTVGARITF
jgi:hypothetical protein